MDPTGNTQNGYIAYPFLTTRMPWWSGARLGVGGSDLYGRPVVPSERLTELELAAVSATVTNLEGRVAAVEARLLAMAAEEVRQQQQQQQQSPSAPPSSPSPSAPNPTTSEE